MDRRELRVMPFREIDLNVKCGNAGELALLVFAVLPPIIDPGQTRCRF